MSSTVELPSAEDLCLLVGDVWASFLGTEIVPYDEVPADSGEDFTQIISTVSISGEWNGHLLLQFGPAGAAGVAQAMFGLSDDELTQADVIDAVGEIGNIVAGNIKSMLPEPSTLSLPYVVFDAKTFALPCAQIELSAVLTWEGHCLQVSLWAASNSESGKR